MSLMYRLHNEDNVSPLAHYIGSMILQTVAVRWPDLAVSAGTAGGAGPFEDARAGGKTPRKTWPRDFGPRDDARVVAVDPTGDTSTRGTARPA